MIHFGETFEIYNGLHNLIVKYYEVIEKYSETFTKRIVEINLNRCFELRKHMPSNVCQGKKNNKTSNKKNIINKILLITDR